MKLIFQQLFGGKKKKSKMFAKIRHPVAFQNETAWSIATASLSRK